MKAIAKIFFFFLFFFSLLSVFIGAYEEESEAIADTFSCEEFYTRDTNSNSGIRHQRSWRNSKNWEEYCTSYKIEDQYYKNSSAFRNEFTPHISTHRTSHGYWGNIYKNILQFEHDRLYRLQDSLQTIGINKGLSSIDFAEMVVSFVQDIPYNYIMGASCDEITDGTPCLESQKFGLLTPVEFLRTLKGDCDTRTTLLYKLLKHFKYEVKVVISSQYAHAMLAVNLPVTGDHLTYQGRDYYFWETTNVGWQPGMLSAEMKNINYWKIALD